MTNASMEREARRNKSLVAYGAERLRALCYGAGAATLSPQLCALFEEMLLPWGQQPLGSRPRYRSNVADDEAPFEFSVGLSDGPPEVQFYVEAQGEPPTVTSNMRAGRALVGRLGLHLGADLTRLHAIEDLFLPPEPQGPFTIWVGATCVLGKAPHLKVYLNPGVRGAEAAPTLITDAMTRLGFARAWERVQSVMSENGRDEVGILSLDLAEGSEARVKLYVRHYGGRIEDVHRLASTASDYSALDVDSFYDALAAGDGPFYAKPPITELAFTSRSPAAPSSVTVEFPIGKYAASDEVARLRIGDCLRRFGLSASQYDPVIQAFATRPLAKAQGIQAHVTLRRLSNRARIAVYFASDAYRTVNPVR